jgi:hypothetical protein
MPEHMPEDMPDRMPDRMPGDMPEHMPEDMPDRKPEDLPVTKCINVMVGITRSKVFFSVFVCVVCLLGFCNSGISCMFVFSLKTCFLIKNNMFFLFVYLFYPFYFCFFDNQMQKK